ncbi:hypothetical protein FA13DRAFT_1735515 [Coprinellus micaceus]|uniref:Uncharacterized protein n=1 Tax=Coprinellus micaceus TaxID=71717 RepID=A0A4Y7T3V1_COPMI|nr:hypothetical protein FA13DRAFT_1735515 [Coprinellus micaceus]
MSSSTEDPTRDSSPPSSSLNTPPAVPSSVEPYGEVVLSTALAMDVPPSPPPTPREEVLSNRDILTLIFETFLPPASCPPEKATRGFLHRLALLSRPFSGAALDCLWKDLDSLLPLVRLLDPLVFVEDGVYYPSGSISGLSDTFSKYASRVRSLHILEETSTVRPNRVDPSVYLFLTQFLNGKPLLPGLGTIHFETVDDPSFSWQTLPVLFPCPSLSSVVLTGSAIQNSLSRRVTVPLLVTRSPSLKSFAIDDDAYAGSDAYETLFTSGILQLRDLQSLSCALRGTLFRSSIGLTVRQKVPPHFLNDLGTKLRHLEQLKLGLELPISLTRKKSKKGGTASATQETRNIFPNLHRLSLSHLSDTHFMKCENISSLLHNIVFLTLTVRQSWISSLTDIVIGLARSRHLCHLTLMEDSAQPTVALTAYDIHLILTHLNLDELHIQVNELAQPELPAVEGQGGAEPDPSEPTTGESATSCLRRILTATSTRKGDRKVLRSLTLPQTWEEGDAGVTLLAEVAMKAPYLECLGISFDSSLTESKTSDLSAPTGEIRLPSALKYLHICDSRTSAQPFTPMEYKSIAQYLDACFPNLMELNVQPSSNACVIDHWAHVEHLRVMYQEIRRLSFARMH